MLRNIKLENFRNHSNFECELENSTIFIGKNGAGKSNILEAISLLSFCKSFRDENKKNLIMSQADFARIVGDDQEVFLQREPFLFKVKDNGVFKKQIDFIGKLKSVVFSPEAMNLVYGTPKIRRRFVDIMISQKDRSYLKNLSLYEKVRLERNALLQRICEGKSKEAELDFWDVQLFQLGESIVVERIKAIEFINSKAVQVYREVSGKNDILSVAYEGTFKPEESFLEKIRRHHRRDIAYQRTMIGPHRDDLTINLNNNKAENYTSRGESRTIVLALKIAELEYLRLGNQEDILLILDDLFSELDYSRREYLSELIGDYQSVVTTTEADLVSRKLLKKAKLIEI